MTVVHAPDPAGPAPCRGLGRRAATRGCGDGLAGRRRAAAARGRPRRPVHRRRHRPPRRGRRQAVPAAADPAGRRARRPAINDDVVAAAAGVELTHLASLYHDDVMDEADVRRGAPSANARYGNSTAILVGDLLFGTASEIVADLGPEAVKIQAQTFVRLCAGPDPRRPAGPGRATTRSTTTSGARRQDRRRSSRRPRRYGAMFAGCRRRTVEDADASTASGSAWPSSSPTTSSTSPPTPTSPARRPGTDLREGVPTLPVLLALALRPTRPTPGCASCSTATSHDDALHAEALGLLRATRRWAGPRAHPTAWPPRPAAAAGAAARRATAKAALLALATSVVDRVG